MSYLVKEIFGPTIQGEGCHAGQACVFLRFAVCNLQCTWCDTDFSREGARTLAADEVVELLLEHDRSGSRLVIVTGGEPSLQWDETLASAIAGAGFTVHMESNGTRELDAAVDWLTISPKPQFHDGRFHLLSSTAVRANECKVVVDDTVDASLLDHCRSLYPCEHYLLQPCMDGRYQEHVVHTLELLQARPGWRLSLQLHKLLGLP